MNTTKKILTIVTAIIIAIAIAVGTCCLGYASRATSGKWFGNSDLATWHWGDKGNGDTADDDPAVPDDTSGLFPGDIATDGVSLTCVPIAKSDFAKYNILRSDSACRLVATVEPENATIKSVTWSVYWEDDEETDDIRDYVDWHEESENVLILSCKKAFEYSRIYVTVKSDFDNQYSATCVLDYLSRLTSVDIGLDGNVLKIGSPTNVSVTPHFGSGTKEGTVSITNCTINCNSTLVNAFKEQDLYSSLVSQYSGFNISENLEKPLAVEGNTITLSPEMLFNYGTAYSEFSSDAKKELSDLVGIVFFFKNSDKSCKLTFTVSVTYEGASDSKTVESTISTYDTSAVLVPVSGLKLNETHFTF